ncbi:hypothetical protein D3C84_1176720 [compost metagenome]
MRLALIWGTIPSDQDTEARKAEMRSIVDAIKRRDAVMAKHAYTVHLTNSMEEALNSAKLTQLMNGGGGSTPT